MLPAASAVCAAGSGVEANLNLRVDSRQGLDIAGGIPVDGDALSGWDNRAPGEPDLSATDPTLQPTVRIVSGLTMIEFAGLRHLAGSAGTADVFSVIVVDVPASLTGERVLVTRDTSATTTKPAYSLSILLV